MDRDEAVDRLPLTYQRIIAWLDDGRTADEIAARLGIDPSAVPALIELATAKLERAAYEADGEK